MKVMKAIFVPVLLLVSFAEAFSQELPSLPKAKEITTGLLDNGVSYYLVSNSESKGFADIALIQKGRPDIVMSRRSLVKLPHMNNRIPYRFLASQGIGAGRRGYVSYLPEATRFDFPDVPVYDQAVSDSTLMMIFDMTSFSDGQQAIVVSGDIAADKFLERMKMFSLLHTARETVESSEAYIWNPNDTVTVRTLRTRPSKAAAINLFFSTARTNKENLNTPVTVVTKMYSSELGYVLDKRLRESFRENDIPLARVDYRYSDSASGPEDERYRLSVYTSVDSLKAASRILGSILASLDTYGVGIEDFHIAKNKTRADFASMAGRPRTNSEYLEQCAGAFLYGTDLASPSSVNDFVSIQTLAEDRELELFDGFMTALLDSACNLSIRYDYRDMKIDRQSFINAFNEGWKNPEEPASAKSSGGIAMVHQTKKLRLRSDISEPLSGGRVWTFSNGMSVVYKKMPDRGRFRYGMLFKGGFADVRGLRAGEGAYLTDMFRLARIDGVDFPVFEDKLRQEGILMEGKVSLSDFRIIGSAPSDKLPLLISALASAVGKRSADKNAFRAYRRDEEVRAAMEPLFPKDVNSVMDSLICPDYVYREKKTAGVGEDLQERAEEYFSTQFSKCGDGILVLCGDLDEEIVKKELGRLLKNFRTQGRRSARPSVERKIVMRPSPVVEEAEPGLIGWAETGVNMELNAAFDFNLENYMSMLVAGKVLRKELVKVFAEEGYTLDTQCKLEVFPSERFVFYINAAPCFGAGLPEGKVPSAQIKAMSSLRNAINGMPSVDISGKEIAAYKAELMADMQKISSDSEQIVDLLMLRYSEGKNLLTNYKQAVDAVSAGSVKNAISVLCRGAIAEYVIANE